MNKPRIWLLSVALTLGFLLPCFASEVQGLVKSTDASNNAIEITDPVSGAGRMVHVHPKVIRDIKKGDVVKATLKSGSDDAETLEVLTAK